jgi:hypothetical protein
MCTAGRDAVAACSSFLPTTFSSLPVMLGRLLGGGSRGAAAASLPASWQEEPGGASWPLLLRLAKEGIGAGCFFGL